MSFGKWYDEKKQQPQPPPSSGGLGGGMGDSFGLSSLFSSTTDASSSSNNNGGEGGDDIESQSLMGNVNVSISSMRSSLESQLPQKIMGMNYQQRFQIFCICLLLSAIFFSLGFFVGIPLITVRPQKFALSFTCGSITFMSSFAILKGPVEHLKSMLAWDRIHFTVVYLGSMMATLYLTFTVGGAQGYVLVLGASALQLVSLLWYLVTFLPGGAMGMKVLTQALWTMLKPLIVGCAKMQAMCISRFKHLIFRRLRRGD
mmetsp:Transcript_33484/g.60318  ORF Transcript_33484/g.60318 Transcript_33484/m.60318 type:complete len:258 (+) Transcript_33484:66-839(+)